MFKVRHRSHACEGITTTCREKETCCKGHSSGTIRLQKRGLPSGPLQGHSLPGHFLIEEGNNATTTQRRLQRRAQCTSPMITLGRIGTRSWTWYAQSCWNGMEYKKSQRMQGERNLEGDWDDSAQRWWCRYRRAYIILHPNPRSRFRSSVRSCSCTNGLSIT